MAIEHVASGQLIDIRQPPGQSLEGQSHALCKTKDLEVMRLMVPAQKTVPPHHVRGDLTIQCLEGEVELTANGKVSRMTVGHLVWLAGGVQYSITALRDASLLVTMVLHT
jgi:quercetin dioxygenase-like cupin family protein